MGVTPDVSNLSIRRPCALVSGSFSVPLSLLVELGCLVYKKKGTKIEPFLLKTTVNVRPELPHDCISVV